MPELARIKVMLLSTLKVMGVLRREKRVSVSLHAVKGHSCSFLPTALVLTSVTMRRLAHVLLLLELIVLSGTNCSKLETLHTVLLLLTYFAASLFLAQLDEKKKFWSRTNNHVRHKKDL